MSLVKIDTAVSSYYISCVQSPKIPWKDLAFLALAISAQFIPKHNIDIAAYSYKNLFMQQNYQYINKKGKFHSLYSREEVIFQLPTS